MYQQGNEKQAPDHLVLVLNAVDYMEEINIPCQVSKEKLSRECNNYVIELEERREGGKK
jgi:hypothetical protein